MDPQALSQGQNGPCMGIYTVRGMSQIGASVLEHLGHHV